jgi:phenylpropionate dioxygenase-like ring-hydroxylating dioxygenase large terminal subunit
MSVVTLKRQADDSPFCSDPAQSFTLPARYYTDAKIYAQEKEAIFYQSWWYAGHQSQLVEAGCYLTAQIQDQNIIVIRDKSGELKAYYNVCQHRGHELLSGSGKVKTIVCPYHAWSYGYDGELRGARNSQNMVGFDKCEFSLKPVQVEVFCGLVFVNLDMDATALKDQAADLEAEIREFCPRVDEVTFAQRDEYEVASNWKVMIDNFLECYHCQPAHKDFVDLVDMKSYRSLTNGIYSSHISNAALTTDSAAYHFEKGDVDFGYAGWFLWPNLTIWIYPGEPNISTLQMIPNSVDSTIEHQDWFLPNPEPTQQQRDAMAYQKDVLQPEDIGLCESVQRGLKSKGYNQGRFVVDAERSELSEHAVHHFQKMVADALGVDLS